MRHHFRPLPWSGYSPGIQALLITVAWLGTSLVSVSRHLLASGLGLTSGEAFSSAATWMLCYAPWIVATPLMARAIVRFPLHGAHRSRNVALAVAFGLPLVFSVIATGRAIARITGAPGFWLPPHAFDPLTFLLEFLIYSGAIGVLEAMNRGAAARQREQQVAQLQVRRLELENDLRDAQLEALRMKLHPHFLFNALQTVAALMRTDPAGAERMLTRLGDVLRMALRLDLSCEIPLREELNVTRAYLDLERIRFQDRLSVAIDVEDDAHGALVPNLILQPVVENAIRHGVGGLQRRADLQIAARRSNGELLIRVRDNGTGVNESTGGVTPGIGLGVLQSRLARLYPGQADCRLRNRAEGGAEVEIRLPYHTQDSETGALA